MKNVFIIGVNLFYLLGVIIYIYLYFVNDKEHKREAKNKEVREVPSDMDTSLLSYLMYKKIIDEVMISKILNLIKENKIKVKKLPDDYILKINNFDNLKKSDEMLIDMLFGDISASEEITLRQIEEYSSKQENCSKFLLNYQMWKKRVLTENDIRDYYESKKGYQLLKYYKYISILIIIINLVFKINYIFAYATILFFYILLFYFYKSSKRTKLANELYYQWKNFSLTLNNYNKEKLTEDNYPKYLIYSFVLGNHTKVIKENDLFLPKLHKALNKTIALSKLYGNRSINGSSSIR